MKLRKLEKIMRSLNEPFGDLLIPGKLAWETVDRKNFYDDPITALSIWVISLSIPLGIYSTAAHALYEQINNYLT